jgi:hypothetical protein
MVTLFGGHREKRFWNSLSGKFTRDSVFSYHRNYLTTIDGLDLDDDGGSFRVEVFVTRHISVDALVSREGSVLVVKPAETIDIVPKHACGMLSMNAFGTPGFCARNCC